MPQIKSKKRVSWPDEHALGPLVVDVAGRRLEAIIGITRGKDWRKVKFAVVWRGEGTIQERYELVQAALISHETEMIEAMKRVPEVERYAGRRPPPESYRLPLTAEGTTVQH